ncbi:MAG: sulfite exporter TauE/SafE family protein [Oscillospiraceae bacterium]|nr:sulfite exporter TauE/SafE family protein [Oscillospiraceae bacterium]MBR3849593.1 sulfite exporter TauE/SafE family protein [Oscillospiraceae bacterium]
MKILGTIAVGAVCGLLSAFGVGGGSILMVWMTAVLQMPQQEAQQMNLLYFLPTAGVALLLHAKHSLIDRRTVIPAALCGCATAICGTLLSERLDPTLLQKIFGAFLIFVGFSELKRAKNAKNHE